MPLDQLESPLNLLIDWKQCGVRRSFGAHVNRIGDDLVRQLLGTEA